MCLAKSELSKLVERLWAAAPRTEDAARETAEYQALAEFCRRTFTDLRDERVFEAAGLLLSILRSTGSPWSKRRSGASCEAAVAAISNAFGLKERSIIHLCPLDCAARDLPNCRFGNAEIADLSRADLAEIIRPLALEEHYPALRFDVERLCQFKWLIVRERRETGTLKDRLGSLLDIDLGTFDLVEPYAKTMPDAVGEAVFKLLLFPWEDNGQPHYFPWEPFSIPWVYSIDLDPLRIPARPPSADSLSWEPDSPFTDADYETERPMAWDLGANVESLLPLHAATVDERVAKFDTALPSDMHGYAALARHFLVKGFRDEGIDSLLAHVTVIDSLLGNQGGSGNIESVDKRLRVLTGNQAVCDEFLAVYKIRSNYLHGRPVDEVLKKDLIDARRAARWCVSSLVDWVPLHPAPRRSRLLKAIAG
jgi:hypothetical protein